MTELDDPTMRAELDLLVEQYRTRCLWFLKPGYYPKAPEDIERVLEQIERHGDLDAFQRAARIRRWLSPPSSESSASS